MKLRLAFITSLFMFSVLGYWGHDLPTLDSPAEALPEETTKPDSTANAKSNKPELALSNNVISDSVIEVATSLANRSRYVDAITLLQTIPAEDKNFTRASRLQNLWGEAILMLGQAKLKQGKTSEGRAILKSIPQTVRAYAEAKKLLRK